MSARIKPIAVVVGALVAGSVVAHHFGYKIGTNVVVRCRKGHLFTTIWIPGVKLKGLDLGIARVQHCPVGRHWSLVVPVREAALSEGELQFAREHHDVRIP